MVLQTIQPHHELSLVNASKHLSSVIPFMDCFIAARHTIHTCYIAPCSVWLISWFLGWECTPHTANCTVCTRLYKCTVCTEQMAAVHCGREDTTSSANSAIKWRPVQTVLVSKLGCGVKTCKILCREWYDTLAMAVPLLIHPCLELVLLQAGKYLVVKSLQVPTALTLLPVSAQIKIIEPLWSPKGLIPPSQLEKVWKQKHLSSE